ncbi:MAG: tRNA-modifying protein YgfZ [Polyangiaceae bacterium]
MVDETASLGVLVVRETHVAQWARHCDVTKLTPEAALYGLAVTPKGRVLTDLVFTNGEEVLVLLPASEVEAVARSFDHYLVMGRRRARSAAQRDASSPSMVRRRPRSWPRPRAWKLPSSIGTASAGASSWPTMARSKRSATRSPGHWPTAAHSATRRGEALRLTRGVPRFGVDFGPATYPQEAGLEKRAISFDKGCYLGQEVVCMLQLRGHVKRRLVSLRFDSAAEPGAPIATLDGQSVGSSRAWSRRPPTASRTPGW